MSVLTVPAPIKALDRAIADLYWEYAGGHHEKHRLIVPSLAELAEWHQRIERRQHQVNEAALPPFWHRHFTGLLDSLAVQLELDQARPHSFIYRLTRALEHLTLVDDRSAKERASLVEAKLERSHQLLGEVRLRLTDRSQLTRREAIAAVRILKWNVREVRATLASYGTQLMQQQLTNLRIACDWFIQALGDLGPPAKEAPLDYRSLLSKGYQLDWNEILSWYLDEWRCVREKLAKLAASVDPWRSFPAVWDQAFPSYDSPESLVAAMEACLVRARHHASAWVHLPPGERCTVDLMSATAKRSFTWATYDGTGDPLTGQVMLNADRLSRLNQGWLQVLAVHYGYPGLHAHRVKTAASRLPYTFRCGHLAAEVLVKGMAQRSERLMQSSVAPKAYAALVQYRRLVSITGIGVEHFLSSGKNDWQEIKDVYREQMGFDESASQAQARSHLMRPGREMCHYCGLRELEQLQAKLGWDDARFTEECLGWGFVSMNTLGDLLFMSEEERAQVRNFVT